MKSANMCRSSLRVGAVLLATVVNGHTQTLGERTQRSGMFSFDYILTPLEIKCPVGASGRFILLEGELTGAVGRTLVNFRDKKAVRVIQGAAEAETPGKFIELFDYDLTRTLDTGGKSMSSTILGTAEKFMAVACSSASAAKAFFANLRKEQAQLATARKQRGITTYEHYKTTRHACGAGPNGTLELVHRNDAGHVMQERFFRTAGKFTSYTLTGAEPAGAFEILAEIDLVKPPFYRDNVADSLTYHAGLMLRDVCQGTSASRAKFFSALEHIRKRPGVPW